MNIQTFGAFAAVAVLAACNTAPPAPTVVAPVSSGPVPGSQEDLVANVGDRVFFEYNRTALSADSRATLDKQSGWLGRYAQNSVQVAGNADERGTQDYNIALGQRRANAARDYLVAQGVSTARITTISYGKDRPVALGSNEQAWAQNRNAITSVR